MRARINPTGPPPTMTTTSSGRAWVVESFEGIVSVGIIEECQIASGRQVLWRPKNLRDDRSNHLDHPNSSRRNMVFPTLRICTRLALLNRLGNSLAPQPLLHARVVHVVGTSQLHLQFRDGTCYFHRQLTQLRVTRLRRCLFSRISNCRIFGWLLACRTLRRYSVPNMEDMPNISAPQHTANSNKRKRARQACDHCRAKKIRCTCNRISSVVVTGCRCFGNVTIVRTFRPDGLS
jgi:hypothetical protein